MYLYISSAFSIMPNTAVYLENNHARLGGAIYVCDANSVLRTPVYQNKNASSNSLGKICLVVWMSNLFSRTTLLMSQEVCYMVV